MKGDGSQKNDAQFREQVDDLPSAGCPEEEASYDAAGRDQKDALWLQVIESCLRTPSLESAFPAVSATAQGSGSEDRREFEQISQATLLKVSYRGRSASTAPIPEWNEIRSNLVYPPREIPPSSHS
jgi:hypothetical protein